ncbi:MAG: HIRAN domain-containing protein [Dongiaceae bacterium]
MQVTANLSVSRLLKNVGEAADARREWPKKRSLPVVNEHFEAILNAADATQIVFQQPVRGTRYYKATELLQKGSLSSGLSIRLEHQPDNPHDKNAVAVRVKRTGEMLGHISKELAPKYSALINSGNILEASIANITKEGAYIKIDVRIVYEQSDDQLAEKRSSRLWQSASSMPAESGVYAIRNIESGRQYIGSSNNIKGRIRSHIKDLSLGRHANHALQSDFSKLGLNYFEAKVLVSGVSVSNLAADEASRISSFLNAGKALYNLTIDGKGSGRKFHGHSNSEPASDRLARESADVERRRIDKIFTDKRKQIFETFEPRLAALLPETRFRAYFATTFIAALIALITLAPNIKNDSLFILSTILALVTAPFIQGRFIKNAKSTAQYQDIIRQRDEKLDALENERNTQNL